MNYQTKILLLLSSIIGCFVENTPVLMANNPFKNIAAGIALATMPQLAMGVAVPIQEVQLLDYAVAHTTVNSTYGLTASKDQDIYLGLTDEDPYTSDQQRTRDKFELNEENWNEVVFVEVNGSSTAKLALHNDWINQEGYKVDAVVNMNLPEQGISGPFRITSIKHIIPQKKPTVDDPDDEWEYRPVTALFTHVSDQIYNIEFVKDPDHSSGNNVEKLGVTYQHPIYSISAGDWRLAGELEIGEKVLTYNGEAEVLSSVKKEGSETVYNLEVKELHNFLVGESGVLVHNSCWGGTFKYAGFPNPIKAIDHIWGLHSFANKQPGVRSYFASTYSTPGKIKQLVQDAIAKGAKNMVERGDGSFMIVVEMAEVIGKNQSNNATKWMTVIIDKAQDNIPRVRNSFPGT